MTVLPAGRATQLRPGTSPEKKKTFVRKSLPQWNPGDTILGTYRVEDVITSGGMGRIYVTTHLGWKVKVAIKAPTEEMLSDKEFYARIVREADAWTSLGLHPHIAYCYFVRAVEDVPHLFVEYVDGGNLRDWVEKGKCADFRTGLDLAIQFCHGMAYAHSKGMIHRDIKPENILMTKDGILKITDFGIARWGKEDTSSKDSVFADTTKTIGFIGTKAYASPEQLRDAHTVGPETDLFSFGVCLWEMLLGRRPYPLAIEKIPLPDPKSLRPDLPDQLAILLTDIVAYEQEIRKKLGGFAPLKDRFDSLYQELFHESSPHRELEQLDLKAGGLNNRGVSYLELGKEEEATNCFEEALKEDRQHLEATFNYGYLQWQRAEITDDVLVTRMKELELSKGNNPDYWRCLAWTHLERGDIDAIEAIQASGHKVTDPDFLKAYSNPNKPVGRLVRVFKGHTKGVNSVCFSPDGRYALSGGNDYTLRLWEVATGKELRRFEGHTDRVYSVCFSPDGRYALSGSEDNTLRLWEVATAMELRRFEGHINRVNSVCFSPDGRYALSGSADKTLSLWDTETGKELRRVRGHGHAVRSVCFSPDGRHALSGGDDYLRLWEVGTGKEVRRFEGHTEGVQSVCFSPDGRYALSGIEGLSDNTLKLWEMGTGKELRRFERHTNYVGSVCFSPDGRHALSGGDGYLRLWEVETGKELRRFEGHTGEVFSVCFSPDGRYALSGSTDCTLRLWEVVFPSDNWKAIHPYRPISRIKPYTEMRTEGGKARALLGSARGCLEKGSFQEAYQLLREVQVISGYERSLEVLELVALCGVGGRGRRQYLRGAWHSATFEGHTSNVNSVCFSPDGKYALSGSADHTLRLWEVGTGKELRRFEGHTLGVQSVCFSPDGRYALSGGQDNTLRLWEVETWKELLCFEGHTTKVNSVCFSPDGKYALSGASNFSGLDKILKLWEVATGKELRRFEGHTNSVWSVCFSPDGRYALSGSNDHTLRLWEVGTGKELRRFEGHTKIVWSVCFSPGGSYALSGGDDCTLRLWEVGTGKELRRFEGHTNSVRSVCFSPGGSYALSGSWDETLRLWEFDWEWEFPQS